MSPRTQQQFQEMREEKMGLIMDVALEHFAKEGFFKTTISHIARHAGISKGLMYNYFESKEALLRAIIHKSVNEVYRYLDIDRDGHLSQEEFEFFVRKINVLLKEKRYFCQLLMQLLTQNDVRAQFLKAFPESDSQLHPGHEPGDNNYPSQILKMFTEYFFEKKRKLAGIPDPVSEFKMFYASLLGYAIISIYSESNESVSDDSAINKIIELYK